MPKINGIEIINVIKKSKNEYPYIIIISGKPEFILEAKEYNDYIYKIFGKPFLFEKLTETIKEIINQSKADNLDMMIRNELELFKFNKTTRGYTYLLECIKYALKDKEQLKDIKNNLYLKVSKKHNTNILKVKWSIEKCIDSLYKTTNIAIINNYFLIGMQEKLTPKLFITTIVDKLSYYI